ncbi:MAG TPA: hypothetical protein V6D07_11690 [Trichocoleus sp.]
MIVHTFEQNRMLALLVDGSSILTPLRIGKIAAIFCIEVSFLRVLPKTRL